MKKYVPILAFCIIGLPGFAQWNGNTTINNIVANSNAGEFDPKCVTDGANGSIAVFADYNSYGDFYVQKITSAGVVAWGGTASPVPLCVSTSEKYDPDIVPDGAGGAFIAWSDYRNDAVNGEIYIQKINSAGVSQWGTNGLRVTNSISDDLKPLICADGSGGVFVTWYADDSVSQNIQAYAQRYNSTGIMQWAANGIQVSTAAGFRASTSITSDGSNGVIILFLDTRNDPNGLDYIYLNNNDLVNADIFGQRLNSSGSRLWTNNGIALITAPGNQNGELAGTSIPDGSGGVIFVFDDGRNDDGSFTNYDVYAQRINVNGVPLWTTNGVAVCTAAGNQYDTDAASDGAGGIIISIDYESTGQLYAQRINAAGIVSWAANGVPVSWAGDLIYDGKICTDAVGNSIYTYSTNSGTIKAQKLNGAGVLQWTASGAIICNTPDASAFSPDIVLSDNGSAIITWSDARNFFGPSGNDIFASRVLSNGVLAGAVAGYSTVANGNWNNPAIWAGGVVPPAGAFVLIRHAVIANINTSCATLNIVLPAGNLTIQTGITFTVAN